MARVKGIKEKLHMPRMIRQGLGMPESGPPGSTYHPATANPDGSINRARLETPRDPSLPQVPMSQ